MGTDLPKLKDVSCGRHSEISVWFQGFAQLTVAYAAYCLQGLLSNIGLLPVHVACHMGPRDWASFSCPPFVTAASLPRLQRPYCVPKVGLSTSYRLEVKLLGLFLSDFHSYSTRRLSSLEYATSLFCVFFFRPRPSLSVIFRAV